MLDQFVLSALIRLPQIPEAQRKQAMVVGERRTAAGGSKSKTFSGNWRKPPIDRRERRWQRSSRMISAQEVQERRRDEL